MANAGIAMPLNAQNASIENSLNIQVNISATDPSRRFRELVDASQWDAAIEMISAILDSPDKELVELDYAGRPQETRTFVPVLDLMMPVIEAELAKHGPLLERWREQFDPLADRLLDAALTGGSRNDVELLKRITEKYFFSSVGDLAMHELGSRFAERGELDQSIQCFGRLDQRFSRFLTRSGGEVPGGRLQPYPDSDLPLAEIAARLVLLNALRQSRSNSGDQSDRDWFQGQFPEAVGQLGEKEGNLSELLEQFLKDLAPTPSSKATLDHESKESSQPLVPVAGWRVPLPVSGFQPAELPFYPKVFGRSVVWRDDGAIYLADLKTGEPLFDNGPEPDGRESGERGERNRFSIWQSSARLSGDGSRPDRSTGLQQLRLSTDGARVFGVFERQESSYLVGIDLEREGKLLPGFPLLPPFRDQSALRFEGPPVVHNGRIYIVGQRRLPDNLHVVISVLCYELIRNDDGKPLPLLWEQEVCQSEIQRPSRLSDESSGRDSNDTMQHVAARLVLDKGQLFLNSHHGVMSCLAAESGELKWVVRYPRSDWFGGDPDVSRLPLMRTGQSVIAGVSNVCMMPADNPGVFSIDRQSGQIRWNIGMAAANQLLDLSDDTLLVGGYQLIWLDIASGNPVCRYPETFINPQRGMRLPPNRGRGQATVFGNLILFPTRGIVWQIEREPVLNSTRGRVANVLAKLERQEFRHGGHLAIEDGMMIVAGRNEIQAWQVDNPTVNETDSEQDP